MMPNHYTVKQMVEMIKRPNRSICLRILKENEELFKNVPGSSHNHQAWPGGYLDHICEAMNIAIVLYKQLDAIRSLPFSMSDALLITFLHDIEKPWKYGLGPDGKLQPIESLKTKEAQKEFRSRKLRKYGIKLTEEQKNAMKYVEGEYNDYTNLRRVMNPLAALCHLADVTSARIWFDYPAEKNDEWRGAQRVRN